MALRKLLKGENQILRKRCKVVDNIDNRIRFILDDMVETLHSTPNGGALAANQLGILKRLVVIDLGDGVLKLVNPEIIKTSGEQYSAEGCLSFPNVWGKVRRPEFVTVKAFNENGEEILVEGSGLLARCLCHEIDHLNGEVFVEKIEEYIEV